MLTISLNTIFCKLLRPNFVDQPLDRVPRCYHPGKHRLTFPQKVKESCETIVRTIHSRLDYCEDSQLVRMTVRRQREERCIGGGCGSPVLDSDNSLVIRKTCTSSY